MGIESSDTARDETTSAERLIGRSIMSNERAVLLAGSLRALSSPTRLQILSILVHAPTGEATVGQLARGTGLKQPTVTRHLNVLHDAGAIQRQRRGRETWCQVAPNMRDMIEDLVL